jgi:phosphomannomutase
MKISISGVRGIYGGDLDLHQISRLTRLFASSFIKPEGNCLLARDTRPSGRIIVQTVLANLMERGINVYYLNVAPTPMVFREARKYDAGFIVTASHNPMNWNGLKFIIKARGIFEGELDFMLRNDTSSLSSIDKFGNSFDAVSDYVDEVAELISKSDQNNNTVKVGLDPGGGAASGYVDQLFEKLGHKFYCINDINESSSRGPDPTADSLSELCMLVKASHLDFGFAFDLDGDRLVVVNNKGEKLNPDITLLICVAGALNLGMRKFVTSIDTSICIEKLVEQYGGKLDYSKVGEANVVNKMIEVNADAGGEGSSAGFIMPKFNMCRDGFLASATISSLNRKVVEDCLQFASQYVQIRSKIVVDSSLHMKLIDKLYENFKKESSEMLSIDGLKLVMDESWALIRPSNTEHAIRISVESKKNGIQSLYKKISEKVQLAYEQIK